MITENKYDKDYYENGLVTGKSCYVNYRWMPELTLKMAHCLIKHLNLKEGEKVLDFGCAKGYLVKALRILGIQAYGCDISQYAIDNVDPEARPYCYLIEQKDDPINFKINFDWVITKDVLEHLSEEELDIFLDSSLKSAKRMLHVVPLGDAFGKFVVPEYERDQTHVLAKNVSWWKEKFTARGWAEIDFSYKLYGIKDNWVEKYEFGNGFFILGKEK